MVPREGCTDCACVGIDGAYNASHASESGGPLRRAPNHRFRGRPPFGPPTAPRAGLHRNGLPPLRAAPRLRSRPCAPCARRRAASGSRLSAARRASPRVDPRSRSGCRAPAVPSGGGACPAHRARDVCRRGRPSLQRERPRDRHSSSPGPGALGAAQGHAGLRRDDSKRRRSARRARRPDSRSRSRRRSAPSATSSSGDRLASTRRCTSS